MKKQLLCYISVKLYRHNDCSNRKKEYESKNYSIDLTLNILFISFSLYSSHILQYIF